jgi:hypothetical protein
MLRSVAMLNRKFNRIHFESKAMVRTTLELSLEALKENLSLNGLVMRLEQSFEAFTENLSLNGLFIRTEKCLPIGNRAEIMLKIPSASRSSSFTLKGKVVRNDVAGIAFQFEPLDSNSFSQLWTVVNKKSPNRLRKRIEIF